MKKYLVLLAAMMMVIAMVSGVYAGTKTQTVTATATVIGSCDVGTDGTLAFPTIDPGAQTTDITATGSGLAYSCSKGTSFKVSKLSGANGGSTTCSSSGACSMVGTMTSTAVGTDTLGYTVSITSVGPNQGTGFSSTVDVPFTGKITNAQYIDAVTHNDYSEVVTVEISY